MGGANLPRPVRSFPSSPLLTRVAQVNPVYQGKGIGAKLVSWGLEQATKEAVAVTLSTSTVAEPLYRRMGFNTWTVRDYPGIRMGTPSLVYWPAGVEVVATREN